MLRVCTAPSRRNGPPQSRAFRKKDKRNERNASDPRFVHINGQLSLIVTATDGIPVTHAYCYQFVAFLENGEQHDVRCRSNRGDEVDEQLLTTSHM